MKSDVKNKIDELIDVYDDLTININPKYWRKSGRFFTNIKEMKKSIDEFEQIEDRQIDSEFINNDYMKWYEKKYPQRYKSLFYNL